MGWNFFKRRKGEQPSASLANDNVVQFKPKLEASITRETMTVGEQELVDLIIKELRAGGAVILELGPEDD